MKNKIQPASSLRKVYLLSALFFIAVFFSCKKDGELVPAFDGGTIPILFTDTLSLVTSLERDDSIRTDGAGLNLLGLFNDPVFGPSSSSIYSQVTLNGVDVSFGTNPVLDSIVLTLEYANIYGDSTTPMTIDVFEITTPMDENTAYYSNTFLTNNPTPIASKIVVPNLTDSIFVPFDSTTLAPHLRINLGNTFGQEIINESGGANLASNTAFTQFLNGLYITTQNDVSNTPLSSGEGSIISFDVNSSVSTVTIYYNDTSSYEFIMNAESVKYNRFDHNYTGTAVEAKLAGIGDTSISYIQKMAGVKTKLEIPFIKNLAISESAVINKAELVITLENGSNTSFEAIPIISLVGINADGSSFSLPNQEERISILDVTSNTYTFLLTGYVHDLVYNTPVDYGIYIVASEFTISANRSIIGTEKNPDAAMKLNIYYSKL